MLFDAAFDAPLGGDYDVTDEVRVVLRLLRNAAADEWDTTTPPIPKPYWEDAQGERGPGAEQPPILYVWSPTGSDLEQFSVDGFRYDQTDTIEVQAWSLNASEAQRLQTNITRVLSKYLDDNRVNTPYSTVRPTTENDFREQKPARKTDHYVTSVEIDARGLSVTRELEGGAFTFAFDAGFA